MNTPRNPYLWTAEHNATVTAITLRDVFAGLFMLACLPTTSLSKEYFAKAAYNFADAMLERREIKE